MVLQGVDRMEEINNEPINEDESKLWIDEREDIKEAREKSIALSFLQEKITTVEKELKELENLYHLYNNLLENMAELYTYKTRELNEVFDELVYFKQELHDAEMELNKLNSLIKLEEKSLEKIRKRKENALDLPFV